MTPAQYHAKLAKAFDLANTERQVMAKVGELVKRINALGDDSEKILEGLDEEASEHDPDAVIFTHSFHEGAHEALEGDASAHTADNVWDVLFDEETWKLRPVDTSKAADAAWAYATQQQ